MKLPSPTLRKVHRAARAGFFKTAFTTLLSLFLLAAFSHRAQAQSWRVSSGTWNVPGNWVGGAVPTSSSTTYIDNGGTAILSPGVSGTARFFYVGYSGTGVLNIIGGSVTDYTNGYIGYNWSGSGTATVNSGTWSNSGTFYVGYGGTGVLNISGGNVTDTVGFLGLVPGSSGTATVSSGTWSNSGNLYVGYAGNGALNINGGSVTDGYGIIGYLAEGDAGAATVSSGTWSNSSNLYVGSSGPGTLNITGGVVSIKSGSGTLDLGQFAGSDGTLNLGTGGTAGTLKAAAVSGDAGTAEVNFNQSGTYTFAPSLTGPLTVNNRGTGTTILTGSDNYTGATNATGGVLTVNGMITNSNVTVGSGAVLGGSGTITNSVTVSAGGTLYPGVLGAPSILTTDLTLDNSSTATFNVTSGTAPSGNNKVKAGTDYDQVAVTGSGTVLTIGTTGSSIVSGTSNSYVALVLNLGSTQAAVQNTVNTLSAHAATSSNPYIGGGANANLYNYFLFNLSTISLANLSSGYFTSLTLEDSNGDTLSAIIYYSGSQDRFNGITGFGDVTIQGTLDGVAIDQEFVLGYDGLQSSNETDGGHDIVLTAIPEPSTWAMLAAGAGMLVAFHRRRARA